MNPLQHWMKSGAPWVWLNAAAVSASILLVVGLLGLIAVRGLAHFWPAAVYEITYLEPDGKRVVLAGQIREREDVHADRITESGIDVAPGVKTVERILLKTGNRDLTGADFRWVLQPAIQEQTRPLSMAVLERTEWGMFFGRVIGLKVAGELQNSGDVWSDFQLMLEATTALRDRIRDLEKGDIGRINYRLEHLRLEERKLQLKNITDPSRYAAIEQQRKQLNDEYQELEK